MADISPCWLNSHNALVDFGHVANAPSKDFYHIFVTPHEVMSTLFLNCNQSISEHSIYILDSQNLALAQVAFRNVDLDLIQLTVVVANIF